MHEGADPAQSGEPDRFGFPGWRKLLDVLIGLCAFLLFGMAIIVTVDVSFRALTGKPLAGVFEATEVLLLGMTFLAIASVQARGRQLSVSILSSRLRGRARAASRMLDAVAASIFFGVLLWTAVIDLRESLELGLRGSGLVRIPTAIPLGLVTVGSGLMMVTLLLDMLSELRMLLTGSANAPQKEGRS